MGAILPAANLTSCEHPPHSRLRRPPVRPAGVRPRGRPGGEAPRPGGDASPGGPGAADPRPRGGRLRPPLSLRADDQGHPPRQRPGHHDRSREHAPLRAAAHRDACLRSDARPPCHRARDRRDRHRLRRRDGADPHPGLADHACCDPGGIQAVRSQGADHVAEWRDVEGFAVPEEIQGTTHLLAALAEMRPADLANVIHDLPTKRRGEVAAALDDERLADVLEELPEEDQVEILGALDNERAADVLEEMSPDDAADLIAELPPETGERLLRLMEPEEAEDVRRLMSY